MSWCLVQMTTIPTQHGGSKRNDFNFCLTPAEKLKDPAEYHQWSVKIIKEAEKCHNSKIANLYKQLL